MKKKVKAADQQYSVKMDASIHKRLRIQALKEDKTLKNMITEIAENYLKKVGG